MQHLFWDDSKWVAWRHFLFCVASKIKETMSDDHKHLIHDMTSPYEMLCCLFSELKPKLDTAESRRVKAEDIRAVIRRDQATEKIRRKWITS